ncbi:MAG: nuclear transport factor 2 family protein [Steroidobacteraceae bacterium]|jgi:hypothetical protein
MTDADIGQIVELAEGYYVGMLHGKVEMLERAFEAGARFQGVRDGEQIRRGLGEFIAMVGGTNADEEPAVEFSLSVELLDITGPVAVIKVKDRFRGRTYVDYLTVVKISAVWRIVNKAFTTID